MKQNKETLKQFFETGDKPTQEQYADLIDSYIDAKQPEGEANRRFVIDEAGEVSVATQLAIPDYQAGTNVTIDTSNPLQPIISASGGGTTHLSYDASMRTLASSTGTNAVLPIADASNAGLMKANFYEEGSFSNEVGYSAGSINTNVGGAVNYVRVGNMVYFETTITGIDLSTTNGSLYFKVPFANISSDIAYGDVFELDTGNGGTASPDPALDNLALYPKHGDNALIIGYKPSGFVTGITFDNGNIRVKGAYKTNVYTP